MGTDLSLLENYVIPPIGFGPGGAGYSPRMKRHYSVGLAGRIYNRVTNKYQTWRVNNEYISAISDALRIGYRLIDYSSAYGDGVLLHRAIETSRVPRQDLFITTRVSNRAQFNKTVREEFLAFLHNMSLDYVELLQFHWPVTGLYLDTWREMERLYEEGYVRHLGVANCNQHHLEEIFKICKYRPEVGQFEIHPLFTQKSLIQYYQDNDIIVEAYTPIARYDDRLVSLPLLKRLEQKYKKDFVQIVLRWHVQNGVIPIIRSMNKKHIESNINIFDFHLDEDDMAAIDSININSRLRYDPDNCDFTVL